jgi:hypothetical protein
MELNDNKQLLEEYKERAKGANTITIYACSAPAVLERITVRDISMTEKEGYIGILPNGN